MRFSFILQGVKPFSVNSLYYANKKVKTQAYYDWSFQVFARIADEQIQEGLKSLRDEFDLNKHGYSVKLTAYYPEHSYYRQAGGISARTMDLSNWEKPLVDLLFLPKHSKQEPPYGAPNLQIDDRYIVVLNSKKLPTKDKEPSIKIQISLLPLPTFLESCPHPESHTKAPQNPGDESA